MAPHRSPRSSGSFLEGRGGVGDAALTKFGSGEHFQRTPGGISVESPVSRVLSNLKWAPASFCACGGAGSSRPRDPYASGMARVRGRGHSARVRALTRARRARVHRGCLSRRAKGISGSSHRKDVMRSQLRMAGPTARSKSAFGRPDWAERRRHRLLRGIGETRVRHGVEWHGVAWKRVVSGPVGLARLGLDCDLGPQVCPAMPRYPSYSLTYLSTCTCLLWLISQGAALSCHIYEVVYIRGDLYIVSM